MVTVVLLLSAAGGCWALTALNEDGGLIKGGCWSSGDCYAKECGSSFPGAGCGDIACLDEDEGCPTPWVMYQETVYDCVINVLSLYPTCGQTWPCGFHVICGCDLPAGHEVGQCYNTPFAFTTDSYRECVW